MKKKIINSASDNFELAVSNEWFDKTINFVIFEFLKRFEKDNVTEEKLNYTQKSYFNDLNPFFESLNVKHLKDLSFYHFSDLSNHITDYINGFKKVEDGRIKNPRTINRKLYSIRSFFNFLVKKYNYPKNPVDFRPLKTEHKSSTEILNEQEIRAILDYLKELYMNSKALDKKLLNLRNYLLFGMMILSLRRSEVVNLLRDNIDFENQNMKVLQKWGTFKYIPLPSWIFYLLQELLKLKQDFGYDTNYVFSPIRNNTTANIDKKINTSFVFKLVQSVCLKLDIQKNITPHSFRGSFITINLAKGTDYGDIIRVSWHKHIDMCDYYDKRSSLKSKSIDNINYMF